MAGTAETLRWQEVATSPAARPALPRSGHTAVALPSRHDVDADVDADMDVLVFGGYTETPEKDRQATNETWVFSLHDGAWSQLQTSGGPPRVRLAAQAVRVGNTVYVIGGWDPGLKKDGGDILGDIWALDLSSKEWRQLEPEGEVLQPISRFQATEVGGDIWVHTHRNERDILRLHTSQAAAGSGRLRLESLPVAAQDGFPASRGLHSMTAVGSTLYIFGADRLAWRPLDPGGRRPHVRCSHSAVAVGTDIVFHGGSYYREDGSGLEPLNDTFVLDTQNLQWRWPTVDGGTIPAARNAATMTRVGGRLVLHGGWDPFKTTFNDTFLLDV